MRRLLLLLARLLLLLLLLRLVSERLVPHVPLSFRLLLLAEVAVAALAIAITVARRQIDQRRRAVRQRLKPATTNT